MPTLTVTPRTPVNLDQTFASASGSLPLLFSTPSSSVVNALVPRTPPSP